jgi:hypothetical protein
MPKLQMDTLVVEKFFPKKNWQKLEEGNGMIFIINIYMSLTNCNCYVIVIVRYN